MSEVEVEVAEVVKDVRSPGRKREAAIQELTHEELITFTIKQSRYLQDAKALLRTAAKLFRWMQKPTEAQDIDKFLDNSK